MYRNKPKLTYLRIELRERVNEETEIRRHNWNIYTRESWQNCHRELDEKLALFFQSINYEQWDMTNERVCWGMYTHHLDYVR